ncbi:MAG: hypothetical protein Q7K45_04130 [Nanoarchaeota archaeon]|nr:hypothetical protein [Nanoarchaeota archaeon]
MGYIDNFLAGYNFGKQRAIDLEGCRRVGEEFLAGRLRNSQGKDVYDVLNQVRRLEDEQSKTYFGLVGFLTYQTLHPIQSSRDNNDIGTIILSEVRPV